MRIQRVCSRCTHWTRKASTSASDLAWPKSTHPTPYEIFHLSKSATSSDIKLRYNQLVRIYHPDLHNPKSATANDQFRQILEANSILSSPAKRRSYDQYGHFHHNSRYYDDYYFHNHYRPTVRHNGRRDGLEPQLASNGLFVSVLMVLMVTGALLQMKRAKIVALNTDAHRKEIDAECSRVLYESATSSTRLHDSARHRQKELFLVRRGGTGATTSDEGIEKQFRDTFNE